VQKKDFTNLEKHMNFEFFNSMKTSFGFQLK